MEQYASFPAIETPVKRLKAEFISSPPHFPTTFHSLPLPPPLILSQNSVTKKKKRKTYTSEIDDELSKIDKQIASTPCTCLSTTSNPPLVPDSGLIHCKFEKNGNFSYYQVNLKQLQELTRRTFDSLCTIFSRLFKQPNVWYSRPEISTLCSEKANQKRLTFLNSLSKECIFIFNQSVAKPAVTELKEKQWPEQDCFLIGRKIKGRPLYTFLYRTVKNKTE